MNDNYISEKEKPKQDKRRWKGGAGSAKKGERDSLSVRPSTKALVLPLAEKLPFHSSSRLG